MNVTQNLKSLMKLMLINFILIVLLIKEIGLRCSHDFNF